MDQPKLFGELTNDVPCDYTEQQAPVGVGANEIRMLSDLEMVLAGGGDGIVIWK